MREREYRRRRGEFNGLGRTTGAKDRSSDFRQKVMFASQRKCSIMEGGKGRIGNGTLTDELDHFNSFQTVICSPGKNLIRVRVAIVVRNGCFFFHKL